MNPSDQQQQEADQRPTHPQTDARPTMHAQPKTSAAFDGDEQRPTHDALSDIYNRE